MPLTDREKDHPLIDAGESVPVRYRSVLFAEPRETELIWPGKGAEISNVALPFQAIEQIDEPRTETKLAHIDDIFSLNADSGRQTGGWSNKLARSPGTSCRTGSAVSARL